MSYADQIFIENCKDILENGTWDTDLPALGGRNTGPHDQEVRYGEPL